MTPGPDSRSDNGLSPLPAGGSRPWSMFAILLAVGLFRLWLVSVQPIRAMYPLPHDDELYVSLADSIVAGHWFGGYNQMTLAKGPMLPILIAMAYYAGIPFILAWQTLYSVACIACAFALRTVTGRHRAAIWCGIALLANPMSFDGSEMTQLLRQNVYTSFALLLVSATLALAWGRQLRASTRLLWSLCWGISAAGFYLTREETIWIVPSIAILLTGLLGGAGSRRSRALAFGTGLVIASSIVATIAWMNYRHYGWFTTTELRAREFQRAYAAIGTVAAGEPVRFVPVSAAAMAELYENVESFALLEPAFEGELGQGWRNVSHEALPSLRGTHEIGGGWFLWAFRDSVARAGFHASGRTAAEFYRRLGDEIREACRNGKLDCSHSGVAFASGLRAEYLRPVSRSLLRALAFMATFENFSADVTPSMGNKWSQARYREITGSPVAPLPPAQPSRDARTAMLRLVGIAYRFATPLLLALTIPLWIVALLRGLHRSGEGATIAIAASALAGTVSLAAIVALIDTTSWAAITIRYLHGAYPLLLLYIAASLSLAGTVVRARR